jgi:dTDP-L-rhamnose 4-epimerase
VIYEDGLQVRDFVSVRDVAEANLAAIVRPDLDGQGINVGTGRPRSIRDIAETLARILGVDRAPDVTGRFRKGDVRHCFADAGRLRTGLAWAPRVDFEAGLRELVEWSRGVRAEDRFEQAAAELRDRGLA